MILLLLFTVFFYMLYARMDDDDLPDFLGTDCMHMYTILSIVPFYFTLQTVRYSLCFAIFVIRLLLSK